MPLSRNIILKDNAERLATSYEPKSIDLVISEHARKYVSQQKEGSDFRIDKIVGDYTGIGELEKESQQKEIAHQALELTKEIQEQAYNEAYNLGLLEGQEKAYLEEKARIEKELSHIQTLIYEIKNIKTKMMSDNEKQIVKLCFYLAKRLFMKEIDTQEEYIAVVIRRTLEMVQSDEEINIRISQADKVWIDSYKETLFKELNLDASTRIEEDQKISRGGVVIETNHGVIDASVEQRLQKLEQIISEEI